jgi:hypothetical protein
VVEGAASAPPLRSRNRAWGNPSPSTGAPRTQVPFSGGPLLRASFELDAAYYGAAHSNRALLTAWSVRVLFAALRSLGLFQYGPATPSPETDEQLLQKPRPKLEDTTYWIRSLHLIEEEASLPKHGWEGTVAWRLDVLLALSELPRSRWRVVALYSDGYERSELGALMSDEEAGWASESVRAALREASRHIRRRCEMDTPGRLEKRKPRPGATPTGEIRKVAREWRRLRALKPARRVALELAA